MTIRAGKKAKRRLVSPDGSTTGFKKTRPRLTKAKNFLKPGSKGNELKQDAALIEQAIRERWPSTDEFRTALRKKVQSRAMKTEDDKALAVLAKVAVSMEAQNQKDQQQPTEQDTTQVTVNVVNKIQDTMKEVRESQQHVEQLYIEQSVGVHIGKPRANGNGVVQGALANVPPPSGGGSGD